MHEHDYGARKKMLAQIRLYELLEQLLAYELLELLQYLILLNIKHNNLIWKITF